MKLYLNVLTTNNQALQLVLNADIEAQLNLSSGCSVRSFGWVIVSTSGCNQRRWSTSSGHPQVTQFQASVDMVFAKDVHSTVPAVT